MDDLLPGFVEALLLLLDRFELLGSLLFGLVQSLLGLGQLRLGLFQEGLLGLDGLVETLDLLVGEGELLLGDLLLDGESLHLLFGGDFVPLLLNILELLAQGADLLFVGGDLRLALFDLVSQGLDAGSDPFDLLLLFRDFFVGGFDLGSETVEIPVDIGEGDELFEVFVQG